MTRCALAPHADLAMVSLAGDDQAPEVSMDDEGDISMGYEDDETALVFTVVVDKVCHTIHGTKHIEGINGSTALSKLRINQSYEQQNAGEIVNDLVSQASVETDTIEDGVDFPFYVIDDRQNAYQHIATLARKSGYVAYFTTEGKLYFGPLTTGQAVQTFTYGVDILSFQAAQTAAEADTFTVVGEGAAGSHGAEAWGWLVKDPASVSAQAGDGSRQRIMTYPALRSAEAVQAAADGAVDAAALTAYTGRIVVPGAPTVVIGSSIEIVEVPQDELNGSCLVMRVQHHYSKQSGFISLIDFGKSGDGGFGGAVGGLP
jgi:phage protein D